MKIKNLLIITCILFVILTIGAVSANDNETTLSCDNDSEVINNDANGTSLLSSDDNDDGEDVLKDESYYMYAYIDRNSKSIFDENSIITIYNYNGYLGNVTVIVDETQSSTKEFNENDYEELSWSLKDLNITSPNQYKINFSYTNTKGITSKLYITNFDGEIISNPIVTVYNPITITESIYDLTKPVVYIETLYGRTGNITVNNKTINLEDLLYNEGVYTLSGEYMKLNSSDTILKAILNVEGYEPINLTKSITIYPPHIRQNGNSTIQTYYGNHAIGSDDELFIINTTPEGYIVVTCDGINVFNKTLKDIIDKVFTETIDYETDSIYINKDKFGIDDEAVCYCELRINGELKSKIISPSYDSIYFDDISLKEGDTYSITSKIVIETSDLTLYRPSYFNIYEEGNYTYFVLKSNDGELTQIANGTLDITQDMIDEDSSLLNISSEGYSFYMNVQKELNTFEKTLKVDDLDLIGLGEHELIFTQYSDDDEIIITYAENVTFTAGPPSQDWEGELATLYINDNENYENTLDIWTNSPAIINITADGNDFNYTINNKGYLFISDNYFKEKLDFGKHEINICIYTKGYTINKKYNITVYDHLNLTNDIFYPTKFVKDYILLEDNQTTILQINSSSRDLSGNFTIDWYKDENNFATIETRAVKDNIINLTLSDLNITSAGRYLIYVSYTEGYYAPIAILTKEIIVVDKNSFEVIRSQDTYLSDNSNVITVYCPDGFEGNITVKYNRMTFIKNINQKDENNFLYWTSNELNITKGDEYYITVMYVNSSDSEFLVEDAYLDINNPISIWESVYKTNDSSSLIGSIERLSEDTYGSVSVYINGEECFNKALTEFKNITFGGGTSYMDISKKIYNICLSDLNKTLAVGKYNITIVFNGLKTVNETREIKIYNKQEKSENNITIEINPEAVAFDSYEDYIVTIITPINATGNIIITVNGVEYYNNNLTNGYENDNKTYFHIYPGEFNKRLEPGIYEINVTYTNSTGSQICYSGNIELIGNEVIDDEYIYIRFYDSTLDDTNAFIEFCINNKTGDKVLIFIDDELYFNETLDEFKYTRENYEYNELCIYDFYLSNLTTIPTVGNKTILFKYYRNDTLIYHITREISIYESSAFIEINTNDITINDNLISLNISNTSSGRVEVYIYDKMYFNKTLSEIDYTTSEGRNIYTITAANLTESLDPDGYYMYVYYSENTGYNKYASDFINIYANSSLSVNGSLNYTYGESGSINVEVYGGTINSWELSVVDHSEASINYMDDIITVSGLNAGNYLLNIPIEGDYPYYSTEKTIEFTVFKANSTINYTNNIVFLEGESGNTTINYEHCSVLQDNISVINQTATITFSNNVITISGLEAGSYLLNITTTPENDNYASQELLIQITVSNDKINPDFNISVEDAYEGTPVDIVVTADSSFTGDIIVKIGDETLTVSVTNGKGCNTIDLDAGSHDAIINYTGSDVFTEQNISKTFTVNEKVDSNLEISADAIYEDESVVVKITTNNTFTGNITVIIGDDEQSAEIINGVGNATFTGLSVGNHTATATFTSTKVFNESTKNTTVVVKVRPVDPMLTIIADAIYEGDNLTVNITTNTTYNGNITVSIGNDKKIVEIISGEGTTTFEGLTVGNYTINAHLNGTEFFKEADKNITVNVKPIPVDPELEIVANPIHEGEILTVNITTNTTYNGNITVSINNTIKTVEIIAGKGATTFEGLTTGNHTINAHLNATDLFIESDKNMTIEVKEKLNDLTLVITSSDIYVGDKITVNISTNTTFSGNIILSSDIENKTVEITNGSGVAVFENYPTGKYTIKAIFNGDEIFESCEKSIIVNVKVIPVDPKLTISVASITQGAKAIVKITTVNTFTGTVSVKIANKNYNVAVKNGAGSTSISNLAVGTYNAIATFTATDTFTASQKTATFKVNKKVNVISLVLKLVTVKKSAKKLVLQATLKINKKTAKGKIITFKFNGKTLKAKTNAKGIAKVTVNKNVLKKLKVNKKITYTAKYSTKTVKRSVKVKK